MSRLYRTWWAWCIQHPFVDGVACGIAGAVVFAVIVSFVLPAWALSIPITDRIVVDLGDLPPWVGTIVATIVYWEARKAKNHAAEAVIVAKDLAVKVDGMLVDRDKSKVAEGEKKVHDETLAAKVVASDDIVRDAETAAKVSAIVAPPPLNGTKKT